MRPKYLADADLNRAVLNRVIRAEPGVDFKSATMAGLRGLSDPAVLDVAAYVDIRVAIESLVVVWHCSDATEWRDRLVWIPI